jgi:hypothetical protein
VGAADVALEDEGRFQFDEGLDELVLRAGQVLGLELAGEQVSWPATGQVS